MTAAEHAWLFVIGAIAAGVILMCILAQVFAVIWWLVDRHQRRHDATTTTTVTTTVVDAVSLADLDNDAELLALVEQWRGEVS